MEISTFAVLTCPSLSIGTEIMTVHGRFRKEKVVSVASL